MFEEDMSRLSAKTIRRHLNNVDFFINGYLLLYEPLTIEDGLSRVWDFLDDYYLRKCAGTEGTRKEIGGQHQEILSLYEGFMGKFLRHLLIFSVMILRKLFPDQVRKGIEVLLSYIVEGCSG